MSVLQHRSATRLAQAVWAAYGRPEVRAETDDETVLARPLALNLERAAADVGRGEPEPVTLPTTA